MVWAVSLSTTDLITFWSDSRDESLAFGVYLDSVGPNLPVQTGATSELLL